MRVCTCVYMYIVYSLLLDVDYYKNVANPNIFSLSVTILYDVP